MRTARVITIAVLVFSKLAISQGLSPSTPAKEYIYMNGQAVAIENAISPNETVSPNSLTFGNQNVSTTSLSQTVTVTNPGSVPSIQIAGTNASDFAQTNNCSNVTPSGTCTITVTFTPSAAGTRNASITITDSAPNSPQSVRLAGTGVAAQISINPTSLNAGTASLSFSSSGTVSVMNAGNAELTITDISVTGPNASEFSVVAGPGNCSVGSNIDPRSSCTLDVLFTPQTIGVRNATVTLNDNASGSPQSVPVTGTAVYGPNGLQFVAMIPCRIADTRGNGFSGAFGPPELAANSTRSFTLPSSSCSIPSGAVAYSLNATVVPDSALGYLTLWPAGQAQPNVSLLNSLDGRIKANAAVVFAGNNGAVSAYASNGTHFILDINGYFVLSGSSSSALSYYPVTPCRIANTRLAAGTFGGPSIGAGASRSFPVLSSSCNIPANAQAYALNFTAIPATTLAYLTTWPSGQPQPVVSTLNDLTGTVVANAALVPAGSGGAISVYASDQTDVVIDISGYFAPEATGGLELYSLTSCRALDTRSSSGQFSGTLNVDIFTSGCSVPPWAQAFLLNATVIPPGSFTYLTLWPNGQSQPLTSTLNALDGAITSNMALVGPSLYWVNAFASDPTQLILDISGYFAP